MMQSVRGIDWSSHTKKDGVKCNFLAFKRFKLSCCLLEASSWCPGLVSSQFTILPEVVDGAKVLKMSLFWGKSCLNNITRCFMKFEAKWTTPVVWAAIQFSFWHWMFTYWATTLYPGPLSPQNTTGALFYDQESFGMLKTGFGETWFSTLFDTPFADFVQGKWAIMGYLVNYCSVSPHFCCNGILCRRLL